MVCAQEPEAPVQKAEEDRAQCDRAQIHSILEMPDHGGIYQPQQRHRNVGKDDGPGQAPHMAIGGRQCGGLQGRGGHVGSE